MTDEPIVLGGRYQLETIIGRGGMAEVWRARDNRLGRPVAVKRLRVDLATDSTFQARFGREAQSAAGLNHPNIVSVYDTGEKLDPATGVSVPYIVMELVEGQTLRDILRSGVSIQPEKAFEYAMGVLDALAYSHRHDIIHRDIKPANVMITPAGAVKVMDFGIARAVSDTSATMTQTAAVIGTAQYLSPEQARGETVDARSDVYSAGCLLYELLAGRPPFVGDSPVSVAYQHVREMPIPPSQHNPDITPQMDTIVMKALAKSTEVRYQSASEMRDDCWRMLNGQQVTAQLPSSVADTAAATRALPTGYDQGWSETALMTTTTPAAIGEWTSDDDELEEAEPSKKKRSKLSIALVVLLVALIGALGFFVWKLFGPNTANETVVVPAVLGFKEDAAISQLETAKLTPKVERVAGPADGKGTVTKQDPGSNAEVLVGSTVTITINDGPPTAAIPTGLVGMEQAKAVETLKAAGFTKIDVLAAPADLDTADLKVGQVVKVSPNEGSSLATDQTVSIYVASGRGTIPKDIIGKQWEEARAQLKELGYTNVSSLPRTDQSEDATYVKGQVIATSPGVGTTVAKDTPITLYYATGEATVPNVVGMQYEEAVKKLNSSGFMKVTPNTQSPPSNSVVLKQSPASSDTEVSKSTEIMLTLGVVTSSSPTPTPGG